MTDFNAIIDAAHKATEDHGVTVQRGKKYSQVNTRVELFRRHLPDWGIQTEIVQFGAVNGEPVVMRATITNPDGAVVGCGHAFEIVGAGNVNKTAALENAETSASGRALASIGLAGGEYASLNEIDGAQRKADPPVMSAEDRQNAIDTDNINLESARSIEDLTARYTAIFRRWNEGQSEASPANVPNEVIATKDAMKAKLAEDREAA